VKQEFVMGVTYNTVDKVPVAIFSAVGGCGHRGAGAARIRAGAQGDFTVASRLPVHRAREIIAEAGISGKLLLGLSPVLSTLAEVFLD
jgi:hypothetical protein